MSPPSYYWSNENIYQVDNHSVFRRIVDPLILRLSTHGIQDEGQDGHIYIVNGLIKYITPD